MIVQTIGVSFFLVSMPSFLITDLDFIDAFLLMVKIRKNLITRTP
ncbi:hypothetical protein SAMN04488109_6465 [Chryseolinea serpens]|uniref:Uncharacterized protein n=1 Tax=Chryseolinea serpens TaxID=947013 RepID=A0A1M5XEV9_9BACT|nr:hypothetical protein SAMN04488109_6465 [Chryseolinea serpens]